MLSKENRIRKTKDFQGIFRNQKRVQGEGVVLKIGTRTGEIPRVGIVVSKKVAKQATRRNRIRRLLSEAAKAELANLPPGTNAVIVVLPGIQLNGIGEARQKLHKLFQKVTLLK